MARPVYILDAPCYSSGYDSSLVRAMQNVRGDAFLLTSDSLIDPPEPAETVPGRRYFFLRLSRRISRRAEAAGRPEKLSRLISAPEYIFDSLRLVLRCWVRRPIVHFQWTPLPILDCLTMALLRLAGIPIVYTVHNPLPHDGVGGITRRIFAAMYRMSSHLIFHSEYARAGFSKLFPRVGTPHSIVACGALFDEQEAVDRATARSRRDWPKDELVVLFLGLIKPYKGLDILLEAIARAETPQRMRLVIGASWRFVSDRDSYETLIDKLKERHNVESLEGIPMRADTVDLVCGADLVVFPYREASASAPGMITMRFGTPIIASRTGSFPDMLGEELSEWLVEPGDVGSLTKAIEAFARLDVEQRGAIRERLLHRATTRFAWENLAKQTAEIYSLYE